MSAGYRAGLRWMKISVIYAPDTYLFVKSHRGVRKLAHRSKSWSKNTSAQG